MKAWPDTWGEVWRLLGQSWATGSAEHGSATHGSRLQAIKAIGRLCLHADVAALHPGSPANLPYGPMAGLGADLGPDQSSPRKASQPGLREDGWGLSFAESPFACVCRIPRARLGSLAWHGPIPGGTGIRLGPAPVTQHRPYCIRRPDPMTYERT
jgi:hypothetical protein